MPQVFRPLSRVKYIMSTSAGINYAQEGEAEDLPSSEPKSA